ncbi:hypothetical protein CcI49_08940 [Frankia sp. CcI49]|uniref:SLATT domain-containing protein n=1 Tax=unclassified Frankia TaxID=2632575 RepID=UPI0006CA2F51|nr:MULTISPECIES: SLATT domain-containing protein [unclassified Frankia]KPM50907.1 hypothetical protein ACG83_36075 [Frankia sp. R43]ONH60726.1 hypothetical protein CcI49_08940 [Frankia sp. CcI49]
MNLERNPPNDQSGRAEPAEADDGPLRAQLENLRRDAAERVQAWSRLADRRRRLHYGVGVPAAILASLAGAATLAELYPVLAGFGALISGVLATIQTFLQPDVGAVRAREQAIGWREIREDVSVLLEVDFSLLSSTDRRDQFEQLRERAQLLARTTAASPAGTSPPTPERGGRPLRRLPRP